MTWLVCYSFQNQTGIIYNLRSSLHQTKLLGVRLFLFYQTKRTKHFILKIFMYLKNTKLEFFLSAKLENETKIPNLETLGCAWGHMRRRGQGTHRLCTKHICLCENVQHPYRGLGRPVHLQKVKPPRISGCQLLTSKKRLEAESTS